MTLLFSLMVSTDDWLTPGSFVLFLFSLTCFAGFLSLNQTMNESENNAVALSLQHLTDNIFLSWNMERQSQMSATFL